LDAGLPLDNGEQHREEMMEEGFLAVIDQGGDYLATLSAWSDWLEEEGSSRRARAVRVLVERKLEPGRGWRETRYLWGYDAVGPVAGCLFLAWSEGERMRDRGWAEKSDAVRWLVEVYEDLAGLVGLLGEKP
jgi:hypothetical protein